MDTTLNISIVLFNPEFDQINGLVKSLIECKLINNIYLIDNSRCESNSLKTIGVNYIFIGSNIGYGAGHNVGIQKSLEEGMKYHLVLNPDIIFESAEVLESLINYLQIKSDIGLIMPNIKYSDGQTQYLCKLLPSPFDLIGRRFLPFKQLTRKRNDKYELLFTGYNQIMVVPSLSGCFMMIRTDILKITGGFDERFFMYCEDLDLSRRIGAFSKTVFYPVVSVIHNYEKGSYKNIKLLKYHIVSAVKYFNKWGWIFDKERKQVNGNALNKLGYKK